MVTVTAHIEVRDVLGTRDGIVGPVDVHTYRWSEVTIPDTPPVTTDGTVTHTVSREFGGLLSFCVSLVSSRVTSDGGKCGL